MSTPQPDPSSTATGKRPHPSDEITTAEDEPLPKRQHLQPNPKQEAVESLAGIAFIDREGEGQLEDADRIEKEQPKVQKDIPSIGESDHGDLASGHSSSPEGAQLGEDDEHGFVPSEFIRQELKAELESLQQGPPDEEPVIVDEEADAIESSDDEDDDDVQSEDGGEKDDDDNSNEDEEEEEQRYPLRRSLRGSVRIVDRPPSKLLRTRAAWRALPDEMDIDADDEGVEPGDLDEDYTPEEPDVSSKGATKKKKKRHLRRKKRAFYNPRLWLAGAQDEVLYKESNKEPAPGHEFTCFETGVTLDKNDDCPIGSIWEIMRQLEFTPDGRKPSGTPELDRNDFLKACMRMGRMMDPDKMSVLLGGEYRDEGFCRFALTAMLSFLNITRVRQKLREGDSSAFREKHSAFNVHADGLYESDDELIRSADVLEEQSKTTKEENQEVEKEGAIVEVSEVPLVDEALRDEDEPMRSVEELKHSSETEGTLENLLSFVQRRYLMNMMGSKKETNVYESFFKRAATLGMTFACDGSFPNSALSQGIRQVLAESVKRYEDRRKWHIEPMPAPELGPDATIKHGTIELWRHACKRFSSKDMARLALIQPNRVLDWLTFACIEGSRSPNEELFYKDNNPVASIAPIAVLYLADLAADFSLKVLSIAAAMAIKQQNDENSSETPEVTDDDIRHAAVWVCEHHNKRARGCLTFSEAPIDDAGNITRWLWPELIQRPFCAGETITICDRVPTNAFRVPFNAVNEARVILDSLRQQTIRFFYTAPKSFNVLEPYMSMTPEARNKSRENKKAWIALQMKDDAPPLHDSVESTPNEARVVPATANAPAPTTDSRREPCAENTSAPESAPPNYMPSSLQVKLDEKGECIFDLVGHDFDASMNIANLVKEKFGHDALNARKQAKGDVPTVDKQTARVLNEASLDAFLDATKGFDTVPNTTISYHRLGWICLHALGHAVKETDDCHLSYGNTAHYTNFGEIGTPDKVTMNKHALSVLTGLADEVVRDEAEILMACAAHDDGRPWIDRADVILANSIRKENYLYSER